MAVSHYRDGSIGKLHNLAHTESRLALGAKTHVDLLIGRDECGLWRFGGSGYLYLVHLGMHHDAA